MDSHPLECARPGTACRIFVYGTLAPGRSNEHILAGLAGDWQPATTFGLLLPDGCDMSEGFPALILSAGTPDTSETPDTPDTSGADAVEGLLFTSAELPAFWPELDAFEGAAYRRVVATVTTAAGERLKAYTYELNS